jgi:hypothetical protein
MEIENLKGLNHTVIDESENESETGETPIMADRALLEKLERNFKRSEFYFDNDNDSS